MIRPYAVPVQPLSAALLTLAVQGRFSLSTRAAARCAPPARAVSGDYTPAQALTRLLDGTGCTFRQIDGQAYEIIALPKKPAPQSQPVARPAPPPEDPELSELVVVATRQLTPAARLAYPVSTLAAADLAGQGLTRDADLALAVPALTVTNLGSGRDKILIRGLSDGPLTGRTQSMVGIYLDRVRITYNAPDPDLKLIDLDQVEVLRGPQGALYGAGSLGGVLHIMPARPDPTHRSAWVSTTYGATQGGEDSTSLEGMANLPLFGNQAALRLTAYRENQGGFISNPVLGLKDINQSVREGGRISFAAPLNETWRVELGAASQFITSKDAQYATPRTGDFSRAARLQEPHDNDFLEAHLGLDADFGTSLARLSTAVIRHQVVSRYDASAAPPVPAPPGPVAFDDDDAIESLVSEATLESAPHAPAPWIAGAFIATTRQKVALTLTPQPAGRPALYDERRREDLEEAALFGQATLPLGQDFRLTLGGRYFLTDARTSSHIFTAGLATYAGTVTRKGFAPKINLEYRLSPDAVFYAEAAEGYRSGGANTTAAPTDVFNAPSGKAPFRLYQGDELWNFEAGGRLGLFDHRLSLRFAAFSALWKNIQSDQLLPSGLPYTANIGDGRNRGFEIEGAWREDALVIRGNAMINSPELDRPNPAFPVRADLALAGVPDISAALAVHDAWPLAGDRSVEVDARYSYVGPSRLTFDAAVSPKMGGYGVGRLAVTLTDPQWRAILALDNPDNARADTFAYGNPFTLRTERQTNPLRPRTLSLTLRWNFD